MLTSHNTLTKFAITPQEKHIFKEFLFYNKVNIMSYLMVAFKIFAKFETEKVSSNLKRERENVFLARELTF